ncbi:unnamed protein product [Closterium sp. Naga37s-1]|nr:unnamed protein product [Closterium sp. Naga37s-1]
MLVLRSNGRATSRPPRDPSPPARESSVPLLSFPSLPSLLSAPSLPSRPSPPSLPFLASLPSSRERDTSPPLPSSPRSSLSPLHRSAPLSPCRLPSAPLLSPPLPPPLPLLLPLLPSPGSPPLVIPSLPSLPVTSANATHTSTSTAATIGGAGGGGVSSCSWGVLSCCAATMLIPILLLIVMFLPRNSRSSVLSTTKYIPAITIHPANLPSIQTAPPSPPPILRLLPLLLPPFFPSPHTSPVPALPLLTSPLLASHFHRLYSPHRAASPCLLHLHLTAPHLPITLSTAPSPPVSPTIPSSRSYSPCFTLSPNISLFSHLPVFTRPCWDPALDPSSPLCTPPYPPRGLGLPQPCPSGVDRPGLGDRSGSAVPEPPLPEPGREVWPPACLEEESKGACWFGGRLGEGGGA